MRGDLEFKALHWLRFEKACPVALFERTPRYGHGQPDVVGITKAGFILEIEVKRSLADFKKNFHKDHIIRREKCRDVAGVMCCYPKQFWFLVPNNLVDKVTPLLPTWAGLIRGPAEYEYQLSVVVKSPSNPHATRLTTKEMIRLGNNMANQIYSQASQIHTWNMNRCFCEYTDGAEANLI